MAPNNNNQLSALENQSRLMGWLVKTGEFVASYSIGQYILKKVDHVLWISEKVAQWSVPYDKLEKTTASTTAAENKEKEAENKPEPVLVRPLPWILFFPALIFFRMFRIVLNICALLVGLETVSAIQIVRFIQNRRRSLRAIRYSGLTNIRQKEQGSAQSYVRLAIQWIYSKLSTMVCIPKSYPESSGPGKSSLETVIVSGNNNEGSDAESENENQLLDEANRTVENLIEKINKLANMSSEDDSNFEPTEEEDENSETMSSCTDDNQEVLDVLEVTQCKSDADEEKANGLAKPSEETPVAKNNDESNKSNQNENLASTEEPQNKTVQENGESTESKSLITNENNKNFEEKPENLTNNVTEDVPEQNLQDVASLNSTEAADVCAKLEQKISNDNDTQQVQQEVEIEENEIENNSSVNDPKSPTIPVIKIDDTATNEQSKCIPENTETTTTPNEQPKSPTEQLIDAEKNQINTNEINTSDVDKKQTTESFLQHEQCKPQLMNDATKEEFQKQSIKEKETEVAEDSSKEESENKGTASTDDYYTPKSSSSSSPDRHATTNEKSSETVQSTQREKGQLKKLLKLIRNRRN